MGYHTAEVLARVAKDADIVAVRDAYISQSATVESLQLLRGHPSLRVLGVGVVEGLESPDLEFLSTLVSLRELELSGIELDSYKLAVIARLEELYDLRLYSCRFPHGIGPLKASKLITLHISGAMLSDRDVEDVVRISSLVELDVSRSQISESAMSFVKRLPYLEKLAIEGTGLTPAGLSELEKVKGLSVLGIGRPFTHPGCLQGVGRLRQLKQLHLHSTGISKREVDYLQSLLPNTKIPHPT